MPEGTRVVAIIPARGGSKGLPRKNLRLLAGKPLIAWSIEAALRSPLIDRVIVSTEDEEIARVARMHGAEVPFTRPADLASDLAATEPVLQHAVAWLEREEGYVVDVVVFLQPTDVFRTRAMVDGVVRRLLDDPALDSCFAAYATHKNFWRRRAGALERLAPDITYGPRQRREHLFREDTGLALATRAAVVRGGRRLGERVDLLPVHDEVTAIDIHDDFTFWLAEQAISVWGVRVNE